MAPKASPDSLFFEGFRLEPSGLFRLDQAGDKLVALGSRALDLLFLLAQRQGEIVSKDVLLRTVWAGMAIEEGNLTVQISALRRIIDQHRSQGSCIQTLPGRGYRFVAAVTKSQTKVITEDPENRLPDKPSVAVLPFTNLSGDPAQEYFADGMVEEIITALSRIRWLFVIARNSSFSYKDQTIDVRRIGRELGVRYVLEGSVRKDSDRVRITAQLIDTFTGAHLWADHFEGSLEHVFDLQDQVASSVAGAIEPKLRHAEIQRATRKPTESLDVYDLFLRAVAEIRKPDLKGCDAALILLRRALAIDPYYAPAASHIARVRCLQQTSGVSLNAAEIAEALQLARLAIENGGDDPDALSRSADALAILGGDIGAAIETIEHALALNPNSAATCWMYANLHCFANRPDAAIPAVERAMRLSPLDPSNWSFKFVLAHALMLAGRYGEAMEWVDRSLHDRPSHHTTVRIKVALCGYLGRADSSEWVARLRDLSPGMTISGYRAFAIFLTPAARAIWEDGLRRAGLPES